MNHLTEEQLVFHYYGEAEAEAGERIAEHLETCEVCRASYQALRRVMSIVDAAPPPPPRPENYGSEVWQRLSPLLRVPPRLPGRAFIRFTASGIQNLILQIKASSRWVFVPAIGLLVLAAFLAGLFWPRPSPEVNALAARSNRPLGAQAGASERVLFHEIANHLERSELALIELINSKTNGVVDISLEQALAQQLVEINRLYRQAAARLGDAGIVSVLEDLERTLIEISNGPQKLTETEYAGLRQRLDTEGLLFKVQVVNSQVRAREKEAVREWGGKRS